MGRILNPHQQEALRVIGKSLKTHMVNTPGNEAAWVERARAWDDMVQKATTGGLNRVVARIQSEMSGFALELARSNRVDEYNARRQAMMARNSDPFDALRGEKIMPARPYPGIAALIGEAFSPREVTGSLKPYPREETGIIGNNTLPLSENLRAIVHQFYQESMTHARESGSLSYALSHAP